MKYLKTKQDLEKWIISANNLGYSVPCVIQGGGFSWINDWEDGIEQTGLSLSEDDNYADELVYLKHGDEFEDFSAYMDDDEYESMVFVRVRHKTGYNQENIDYQFGIYDIP